MNCTTYIFGNLTHGYSQYPDDYAKGIFEKMLFHCEAVTQIVTHRKNDLMYYAYIRKCPSNNTSIGLCVVFNSLMVEDINTLFPLFEETVAKISADGDVLTFSNDGDIVPAIDKLEESVQGQIERVRSYLLEKAVQIENGCAKLPPVSYGVDADVIKRFSCDDMVEEIAQASCVYDYTYISKNTDFDNETVRKNRELVKEVNVKRTEAESKYKGVANSHRNKSIIRGCIFAAISFIIGYFIFKNPYKILEDELGDCKNTLEKVTAYKNETERTILIRSKSLQDLKKSHQTEMDKIRKKVPLLITGVYIGNTDEKGNTETSFGSTIYSSSSMYITPRLNVYGLKNYTAALDIKLYDAYGMLRQGTSSPIDATYSDTIRVKKGEYGTYTLSGWGSTKRGNWNSGKYRIEIWNNDICLSKYNFTIN
ncbi:MAG: hypothetical protein IJA98_01860 [Bacteroidaceae bacterium]|nr:hypothetical protein [Bacteroidaceae bacterium]